MALLLASLLGGGSGDFFARDELRAVEQVIEEEARVAATTEIMTRISNRYGAILDQRRYAAARLAALDSDVYAPEDAYMDILEQLWRQREDATNGYIRDVFELRRHVTREEWAAIFGAPET